MAGTNLDTRFDSMDRKLDHLGVTLRWGVHIFVGLFLVLCGAVTVIASLVGYLLTR